MSDNSKIEWTDATWNAARDCTKVGAGRSHWQTLENLGNRPGMLGVLCRKAQHRLSSVKSVPSVVKSHA